MDLILKSTKLNSKDYKNDMDTFFGMDLDEQQQAYKNAILNPDNILVAVDAKAGTGKTNIAVKCAVLLHEYFPEQYKRIIYIMSPVQEMTQGYLPGSLEEKSAPYMDPLIDALIEANVNPEQVIMSESNTKGIKEGTAFVQCITHTFLRGTNKKNSIIIIDEAENYFADSLKKTLTRCHDSCKVILCGHTGQCDLVKHKERSGLSIYIKQLKEGIEYNEINWAQICTLSTNYRGQLANWADDVDFSEL